jgi:hypothetical protein
MIIFNGWRILDYTYRCYDLLRCMYWCYCNDGNIYSINAKDIYLNFDERSTYIMYILPRIFLGESIKPDPPGEFIFEEFKKIRGVRL